MTCKNNIDSVIKWIADQNRPPVSVEQVAKASGYSRFHLMREFQKETGISLGTFLIKHRIWTAMRLLEEGVMERNDIAEFCGYHSENALSRVMKKYHGVSAYEHQLSWSVE